MTVSSSADRLVSEPYLLTKRQMARLALLLPLDKRGVARVDDRRVISGIVHVRGGRTIELHALTDEHGRPRAFALTGGQVADCRAAELLLDQVPPGVLLLADRGYDTDAIRAAVNSGGATPNIPPKANRRFEPPFSPVLYRTRNAIERIFGRLKDFRRIATRYDKLATNFLAAIYLTAAVCYRL